ncbi:DUF5330 domain-containing protein [Hansschlegelia sp. KR7-227]|uniref:DUF5330 domain-containing protein n=1 Tax=Hansschlegelia sp. KR7-227 TaxID=3400914 RepID=UPI003C046648
MFFLLRTAFWISVLLLVLPLGSPSKDGPTEKERASIDALSALAAAGATVSDVGGFCDRQPDACAIGSQAIKVIGERAASGASLIQDYLGGEAAASVTAPRSGAAPTAAGAAPVRDTLTAGDRKPAWRGPASSRPA